MHHLRCNAMPTDPLSNCDEILSLMIPKSVLLSKMSTLDTEMWAKVAKVAQMRKNFEFLVKKLPLR